MSSRLSGFTTSRVAQGASIDVFNIACALALAGGLCFVHGRPAAEAG